MNVENQIISELLEIENPERAQKMHGYFQVFEGGYGQGDQFLGLSNPQLHDFSKRYKNQITLAGLQTLMVHPYHEIRLLALFILVAKFTSSKKDPLQQKEIVDFYLAHLNYVNNWDLVDSSAYKILGVWLLDKNPQILFTLAHSNNVWKQRVAMVSTLAFIKANQFEPTYTLAEILMHHHQDMIHKAVGWMLKELGKRNEKALIFFLNQHVFTLPRVTLRTAIEKLDFDTKQFYLKQKQ